MSDASHPPRLTSASVLRLKREGGLAHFPGLARPRRLDCARCSESQRAELQRLLELVAESCRGDAEPAGADRRWLQLSVEDDSGCEIWKLCAVEESVPVALLEWWRRADSE
ncbi:protealysin inhibitor emfourin [Billgrantia saliphila]|uniref:protealysin inhibitor emfourin n=1 Tax=Billgrantia saliphila TaxID=1848458 RepID=UPI000CE34501|nr:protealysin inhibitor emfourin [Halomonas saliphila]